MVSLICGIFKFLKSDTNELTCKSETDLTDIENKHGHQSGNLGRRNKSGMLGINIHRLLYMR